jgi:hypothetical protein
MAAFGFIVRQLSAGLHGSPDSVERQPSCCCCLCSLLLTVGGHLPMRGAQSAALLCGAVSEGDLAQLRRLLHAGADPNLGDYDKRTALHIAAADCNLPVVSGLQFWPAKKHLTHSLSVVCL